MRHATSSDLRWNGGEISSEERLQEHGLIIKKLEKLGGLISEH